MNQLTSNGFEKRLAQLYSRINYERQSRTTPRSFKLTNMRSLLERLGNPHLRYPVVHVAGTKGKGSVTTLLGSILTSARLKTGVYTSPHLETIHQRIAVDTQLISDAQLLEVLDSLQPVLDEMDLEARQENRRDLTFFEVTTAAMFCHFANQEVDVAVVEVGLGGRLDSTNVCKPAVSVITNISHDHTKLLGETLDAIAREKAGVIKAGTPVISGAINPDASKVISQVARECGSDLFVLDQDFCVITDRAEECSNDLNSSQIRKNCFSTRGEIIQQPYELADLTLNLLGTHQKTNAAIVIATAKLMASQGFQVSDSDIRTGLSRATLIGRTEVIGYAPLVVIDMAHNVASIAALVDALTSQLTRWKTARSRRLVMAISREKDAIGMIRLLIHHFDDVVFTKYQNNPRGKLPEELLKIGLRLRDQMNLATTLSIEPNPLAAWGAVRKRASDTDIVCISGSAYLVAELRQTVIDTQFARQIGD